MSACFHPTQPLLYVAGGPEVFTFDLRADKLILDEVKAKYGNSEGEEINEVSFLHSVFVHFLVDQLKGGF